MALLWFFDRHEGGLALARIRPMLEVAGTPFLVEINNVIDECGDSEPLCQALGIDVLREWRDSIGPLEDSSVPEYFQSTAAGVAVLVAGKEGSATDRERRVRSSEGNFWDSCDDLLHAGGGFSRAEFQGIKTTLRRGEDIWQEGDARLISESSGDPVGIFARRLSKFRANYPRRR
ncbi:hypothetical protein [Streptomyces sp. SID1121]|uniref:hypothetical protein n=1 Tax=Streptomyces sp. SID1121 TaxID=3425888 RepID=UPI0040577A11